MSKLISIGKIIDITWDHYVNHFKTLMRITLWLFLISLISILSTIISPMDAAQLIQNGEFSPLAIFLLLLQVVVAVSGIVIGSWIFLTMLQAVLWQDKKKQGTLKNANRRSWKLLLSYIWIMILKGIAAIVPLLFLAPGVILLIYNTIGPQIPWLSAAGILLTFIGLVLAFIGVIWVGVVFNFSEYLLVFEDTRGVKALKGAKKLVAGRFWATLWRIILPKLVFVIPVIFIQFVLVVFLALLTPSFSGVGPDAFVRISQIADNLISTGIAVLSTPLFIIADYYVYDSLRKTK